MVASLFLEFILLGVVVFTLKLQKPVHLLLVKKIKIVRKIVKSKDGVKKVLLLYVLLAVAGIAIVNGIMVDSVEPVGKNWD